jgi:transcriptional regulator with XRE-family HTH domain
MSQAADVHIGQRVREARLAKGMSQTDLGNQLGISFQQVQKYEKGTNRIGSGRLWAISRILETPISFFFDGLSAEGMGEEDQPLSRGTIRAAKELSEITDPDIKSQVIRLIKAVAKAG